jgi:hypothetical protein
LATFRILKIRILKIRMGFVQETKNTLIFKTNTSWSSFVGQDLRSNFLTGDIRPWLNNPATASCRCLLFSSRLTKANSQAYKYPSREILMWKMNTPEEWKLYRKTAPPIPVCS